jgi:uncharacterized protein
MAKFEIKSWDVKEQKHKVIIYDSSVSTLTWEDGTPIYDNVMTQPDVLAPAKIEHGKKDLKTVKIQLGLSCNFECDYCNQRFVPHADQTNPDDVLPFVENMSSWFEGGDDLLGKNTTFEFWGGEPFVYWKTLKPLAEAIKQKYPNCNMGIITNGSLLDKEKNDWLESLGFGIAVSHDGPGQPVRGPDPFDDPVSKEAILDLYKRLAPKRRFSFNSMINSKNISRTKIQEFFIKFITDNIGKEYCDFLTIGEGAFVDAYDEGGLANSLLDGEEDNKFRNLSLDELRRGGASRFSVIGSKFNTFLNSIKNGSRIESLPQKCGMDKSDSIALDLNGNVLTCQNVSAVSNNPAGMSHKIGHISDLNSSQLNTATHWSDRKECPNCPVIHICKGACMFLSGPLWDASCDNAFSDNIVMFSIAIEEITGCIPEYIEGPLREDRKDIFWWTNGKPSNVRKPRKIIPISVVA